MRKNLNLNVEGFTLSELLLAAAILAFVLCTLLLSFLSCLFLNEANRNLSVATTHAQNVMEEIKDTNFDNIKTQIDSGYWDWSQAEISAEGLTVLKDESIDTQATGTDPLDVVVRVNWKNQGGRQRNIDLETLFTEQ